MVVVGVAIGRLRLGFTLINRSPGVPAATVQTLLSPPLQISSRLVAYNQTSLDSLPDLILERMLKESEAILASFAMANIGILVLPTGESESKAELIRLSNVLEHELRKLCKSVIKHVGIGAARSALGISENVSSRAKRAMIDSLTANVINRDECSTSSAAQTMAESYAVAAHMEQIRLLNDLKTENPEMVERLRNGVLKRKVFQRSPAVKIKDSVFEQLVASEVDRQLVNRFKI